MKKIAAFVTALSICMIFAASATAYEYSDYITINRDPGQYTYFTPTNGFQLETGAISELPKIQRSLFSVSSSEQTFEEYLREKIINHETTIDISEYMIPLDEFPNIFFAFVFCNGDLPTRAGYTSGTYYTSDETKYMHTINPIYIYPTKDESDRKRNSLNELTDSLAEYAANGKTELEKALFLFDKISSSYQYTPGEAFENINYTPYSFLDNGHGVCQAYAVLYKLTLNKLGIESYLCSNRNKDINHAWNYVKIDSMWYHADPTWSYYENAPDKISHNYFLLSDDAITADGKHGAKADWEIQKPDFVPVDCENSTYSSGYLFNEFDVLFSRDEKSLIFTDTMVTENGLTPPLSFRNSDLYAPKLLISEESGGFIYIFSLQYIDTFNLFIAAYQPDGRYKTAKHGSMSQLAADSIIPLPVTNVAPAGADAGDSLKFMLLGKDYLTPLSHYSETTVKE